jgi:putative sporulation protein YyaC
LRKILEQIHFEDNLAVIKIAKKLIENYKPNSLIVNIGTDSLLYDSVGPLVGTMLKKHEDLIYEIIGTLEEPIDFGNLDEKLNLINEMYPENFIIGIDAAISSLTGYISFCRGPIYPGLGWGKKATSVGDISIIAGMGIIVDDFHILPSESFKRVNNYSFHTVYGCAKTISAAIIEADRYIKKYIL